MNDKVVIIGAGMMGPGIAAVAALAGHPTLLVARDERKGTLAVERAGANISRLAEGGLAGADQAEAARSRVQSTTDLARAVRDASIVIEAISETLEAKQELFQKLDELLPPDVLITSNTSGLRITDIALRTSHPERTATTHFWFPGHLIPLVEVVKGDRTAAETVERLRQLLVSWGKSPVVVNRDLPGQLANRILQAVIREAANIVQMGLASAEDVDTAIKAGMALRFPVWGPLEHVDAVGLDLALSVQRTVLPNLDNDPAPPARLVELVDRGELGSKTGKGFYDWTRKSMPELARLRDAFIIETLRTLRRLAPPKE